MDLSKLPRLSKTSPNAAAPEQPTAPSPHVAPTAVQPETVPCRFCGSPVRVGARFCDTCGAQLASTPQDYPLGIAEAWIGIVIAAILVYLYPNFFRFLAHPHDTSAFDPNDANNNVLPYIKSAFIWSDLGISLFCVVLLLDAAVMLFARKKSLIRTALVLSIATALFNVWAIIHVTPLAFFPLQCAIAVALAIYLAIVQAQMLRLARNSA
jgi:hypothetical protein